MADAAAAAAVPGDAPAGNTVLDSLGEDITRIVYPVSACMLLVVLLVSLLSSPSSPSPLSASIAAATGGVPGGDDDIPTALITALTFVVAVTAATFLLALLFYLRCTPCLRAYLGFSALAVLLVLGGQVALLLLSRLRFPLDAVSFALLLPNAAQSLSALALLGAVLRPSALGPAPLRSAPSSANPVPRPGWTDDRLLPAPDAVRRRHGARQGRHPEAHLCRALPLPWPALPRRRSLLPPCPPPLLHLDGEAMEGGTMDLGSFTLTIGRRDRSASSWPPGIRLLLAARDRHAAFSARRTPPLLASGRANPFINLRKSTYQTDEESTLFRTIVLP